MKVRVPFQIQWGHSGTRRGCEPQFRTYIARPLSPLPYVAESLALSADCVLDISI
jgi:hypothetical protein